MRIQSSLEFYSDAGLWFIDTACDPSDALICDQAVQEVTEQLITQGPTEHELAITQDHLRSRILIEEDDLEAGMEHLAHDVIYCNQPISLEDRIMQLSEVSISDIQRVF